MRINDLFSVKDVFLLSRWKVSVSEKGALLRLNHLESTN